MSGRDEVRRDIDFTASTERRERVPGLRGEGDDIQAETSFSCGPVKVNATFRGRGTFATRVVGHFVLTFTALMSAAAAFAICRSTGASTAVTLLAGLGLAAASTAAAYFVLRRSRTAAQPAPAKRAAKTAATTPKKRTQAAAPGHSRPAARKPKKRRRNGRPRN